MFIIFITHEFLMRINNLKPRKICVHESQFIYRQNFSAYILSRYAIFIKDLKVTPFFLISLILLCWLKNYESTAKEICRQRKLMLSTRKNPQQYEKMTLMALVNYFFICHTTLTRKSAKKSNERGSTYFIKNVNVELSENFPENAMRGKSFSGFSLCGFAIASQTAVDVSIYMEKLCC